MIALFSVQSTCMHQQNILFCTINMEQRFRDMQIVERTPPHFYYIHSLFLHWDLLYDYVVFSVVLNFHMPPNCNLLTTHANPLVLYAMISSSPEYLVRKTSGCMFFTFPVSTRSLDNLCSVHSSLTKHCWMRIRENTS